jgi:hypothetical protein
MAKWSEVHQGSRKSAEQVIEIWNSFFNPCCFLEHSQECSKKDTKVTPPIHNFLLLLRLLLLVTKKKSVKTKQK